MQTLKPMKKRGFNALILSSLFVILLGSLPLGKRNTHASSPPRKASECRLEIAQVLEATIYRGPPYMAQMLQYDPEHADFIMSESHGDHHLRCAYKVLLNEQ